MDADISDVIRESDSVLGSVAGVSFPQRAIVPVEVPRFNCIGGGCHDAGSICIGDMASQPGSQSQIVAPRPRWNIGAVQLRLLVSRGVSFST